MAFATDTTGIERLLLAAASRGSSATVPPAQLLLIQEDAYDTVRGILLAGIPEEQIPGVNPDTLGTVAQKMAAQLENHLACEEVVNSEQLSIRASFQGYLARKIAQLTKRLPSAAFNGGASRMGRGLVQGSSRGGRDFLG